MKIGLRLWPPQSEQLAHGECAAKDNSPAKRKSQIRRHARLYRGPAARAPRLCRQLWKANSAAEFARSCQEAPAELPLHLILPPCMIRLDEPRRIVQSPFSAYTILRAPYRIGGTIHIGEHVMPVGRAEMLAETQDLVGEAAGVTVRPRRRYASYRHAV